MEKPKNQNIKEIMKEEERKFIEHGPKLFSLKWLLIFIRDWALLIIGVLVIGFIGNVIFRFDVVWDWIMGVTGLEFHWIALGIIALYFLFKYIKK